MTRKQTFNCVFQLALAQNKGIRVEISSPDMPMNEVIMNPAENVEQKARYYNEAYDDDMKMKRNPSIVMVDAQVVSNWRGLNWLDFETSY